MRLAELTRETVEGNALQSAYGNALYRVWEELGGRDPELQVLPQGNVPDEILAYVQNRQPVYWPNLGYRNI
jgi:hypothetical protein